MAELTDEQIEMIIETEEAVKFITYHYNRGRNDAIDEFVEALKEKAEEMFRQKYVDVRDIDEIAEQLKGVQE